MAIAVAVLAVVFFAMRSGPEATAPEQEASPGANPIQPEPEVSAPQPPVRPRINPKTLIGAPKDYGLTPEEFHQRRLASAHLGRPQPGNGPVDLPGFKYITLDRRIEIDHSRILRAGMDLYEAALDQRILTGAPFTIILRDLDARKCPDFFAGASWEPALPVPADVQSVAPPLVLKEQPAAQVLVDANQPIAFDGVNWCKTLMSKTGNRFAGDVLFRFKATLPVPKEEIDMTGIRADYLLSLD